MVVANADAMDDGATPSIWHAGERAAQRAAGVAGTMEAVGRRNVHGSMPEQYRLFFAQLPFLVAGSVDAAGAPWATILAGDPGFVGTPSPALLEIAAQPAADDPAGEGLGAGAAVGLLGIELHTRRRNRVNGTVRTAAPGRIAVAVEQSFGNCPKYIALRDLLPVTAPPAAHAAETMDALDGPGRDAIAAADVFFVASYADLDGGRQVDVSHRGGRPGFVRVDPDGTLTIPDFAGNRFFMTLGNVLLSGKAGVVFPDWTTGDLLQLTGDAAILSDAPDTSAFRGAERLWTVRPRRILRRRGVLPLRWSTRADGASPNTLLTGA